MTAQELQARLQALADEQTAAVLRQFFKTGPGQYGEGDQFLGIKVPRIRQVLQECPDVPIAEGEALLHSPLHECRQLALFLLIRAYTQGDGPTQEKIYRLYLRNTAWINNWDLVDGSAEHIVGSFLRQRHRRPLYHLARSHSLWERRIAIVATLHFIKRGDFTDTLAIAPFLLNDREDLIHKATGWMLREVGKRQKVVLETFLGKHYRYMPRTMLRYAIERLPEARRQEYLRDVV
jgi:3-methyladenine DNA glycosylase AlkD